MLRAGRFAMNTSMLLVHFTVTLKIKSVFFSFEFGSVTVTITGY